jgi:hypothetical protein
VGESAVAARVAIAAADPWPPAAGRMRRTVHGGPLAARGIPLVRLAIASGPNGSAAEAALANALISPTIGGAPTAWDRLSSRTATISARTGASMPGGDPRTAHTPATD